MKLAKVIGSVVSTQKNETLVGKKLMIVQFLDQDLQPKNDIQVAVDTVGAGIGERVLITTGASARRVATNNDNKERTAVDCAIVGIIDSVEK